MSNPGAFDVAYRVRHFRRAVRTIAGELAAAWRKAWAALEWDVTLAAFRFRNAVAPTELERFGAAVRVFRDASANAGVSHQTAFDTARHVVNIGFATGFDAPACSAPLADYCRAVKRYTETNGASVDKAQASVRVAFAMQTEADKAAGVAP